MKSQCGDKTILRPSYLNYGISYTDKTSIYWIMAQIDKLFWMRTLCQYKDGLSKYRNYQHYCLWGFSHWWPLLKLYWQTAVSPVRQQWLYCCLAPIHWYTTSIFNHINLSESDISVDDINLHCNFSNLYISEIWKVFPNEVLLNTWCPFY